MSTRRQALAGGGALALTLVLRPSLSHATPETMAAAIQAFTKGLAVKPGRVKLDIPPLVENGNSVPLTIEVDSPMTELDHVNAIAVFAEKNPLPNVVTFNLTPRSGKASVSTRIRLGDSQTLVAIAQLSDGSFWSQKAELIVTLPACVEVL
jgi:sulfur-oxidizing protein SoxY